MKDFDGWSKSKISINAHHKSRWCKSRDIWWCRLGINVGFEEDGKGTEFLRPVVIIRAFGIRTALVVPLTSSSKPNPFHVLVDGSLKTQSYAIITQVRLIDTKRLVEKHGKVSTDAFERIRKAIKDLL